MSALKVEVPLVSTDNRRGGHYDPAVVGGTGSRDFEEFARERLPALLRYAAVLSGDRDLAADVVQEVMVRAHAKWATIGRADVPEHYVKKMVTNEYLSWRRRWAVRNIVPTSDEVLHLRAPDQSDSTAGHGERDEMWARLATLPARQRAVLVLRFYEDLSDAEIAETLGCAVGTVRSCASRGLATLRPAATHVSEGIR